MEIDHAHRTGRRRDGIASLDDLGTDEGQIEQHLIELALLTLEARHLRGGGVKRAGIFGALVSTSSRSRRFDAEAFSRTNCRAARRSKAMTVVSSRRAISVKAVNTASCSARLWRRLDLAS